MHYKTNFKMLVMFIDHARPVKLYMHFQPITFTVLSKTCQQYSNLPTQSEPVQQTKNLNQSKQTATFY